jgi:ubiquinone/menaquinone biosynthesis C-methylase UbiE
VIGWVYDLLGRSAERGELGALRRNLLAEVEGDVLEIGAGTGANLTHYRRAARVVALEPDARMSRRLPAKAEAGAVPVEFVAGSAERLPFADASFDAVVSTFVLCSVESPAVVLAEIRRVLRPDGRLVVLEHVRGEGKLARWQERLTPVHRELAGNCHLARDTRSAIEQGGFDASAVTPTRIPGAHPLVRAGIHGLATRISSK